VWRIRRKRAPSDQLQLSISARVGSESAQAPA
jgi:mevalonate pyrophosphate decarboxylase